MSATIHRLRPRKSDASGSVQEAVALLLDDPDLSEATRAELQDAAYRHAAPAAPPWFFVMISPAEARHVLKAIDRVSDRPSTTKTVWMVALTYIRMDTGEVMAGRERIAEDAGTTPQEVSRAMSVLVDIGALSRVQRGRRAVYFVNPSVGWAGSETKRRAAARKAPELKVVE